MRLGPQPCAAPMSTRVDAARCPAGGATAAAAVHRARLCLHGCARAQKAPQHVNAAGLDAVTLSSACSIRGGVGWKGAAAALMCRQAARAPKAFESTGTSSRRDARRCQAPGSTRQDAAGLPTCPDPARRRAGGGRRVIRCEVSLDGETWRRAEIERHETPTPANKTWCWVFWSIPVTAVELLRAPQLRVRAVDSSQNMMPEKCAWSPPRGIHISTVA